LLLAAKSERPAESFASGEHTRNRRDERPRHEERQRRDEPHMRDAAPAIARPATAERSRPSERFADSGVGVGVGADGLPARKPRAKSAGSQMETFRIEVGSVHGIKPGNIVGAIANESGIEGVHIGRVDIREDHSFVDLPEGMPKQIFKELQKVRVVGRELRISRVSEKPPKPPRDPAGRHAVGRDPAGRPAARKMLSRRAKD